MCAWAETRGCLAAVLCEHHGSPDGYLPTPLILASAIAARATMEAALERRETRGCHNRSDYPHLDEGLQVNLVWSGPGRIERGSISPVPQEISAQMRAVSSHGKLVE